jgi:hypothetical protein
MKVSLRVFAASALLAVSGLYAQSAPHRRALLVGINDYTASQLNTRPKAAPAPDRDWPNLAGAVNDVNTMRELLVIMYAFDRSDIVTLTDQAATRDAILGGIEQQLVNPAAKDDVVFFYFAGHGSQVRNSFSEERDKMDESIVPADSRNGAADIRDKELRKLFNRILDRGARLTVMLDNCHSGSGARGLGTGARPRGVKADLRDVADRVSSPRPEDRGALVLSAAQDDDTAWETRDAERKFHGAFSWAWIRAMRDAGAGEPAVQTFQRAQARLRAETPYQEPVIAGNSEARLSPFLGTRIDRRNDRIVVAVEKIQSDATIVIQGGWASGLTVGTELREPASNTRLIVTALRGISECEARLQSPGAMPRPGALLEVAAWAAPPVRPLRVWIPRAAHGMKDIAAMGRSLAGEAKQHGVQWTTDPIDATPAHVLRWSGKEWELFSGGEVERIGTNTAAIAAVSRLSPGETLFVQFPVPVALIDALAVDGVEKAARPEEADYVLVGRFTGRHLSFAWLRPSVKTSDRRKTGLPLRTAWVAERRNKKRLRDTAPFLREALLRLRKIHGWLLLESPPGDRFPYQLAARRARDGTLARADAIIGDEKYELVLRVISLPLPAKIPKRYIYAFVIDSSGKSTLLFPPPGSGSVENHFQPSGADTEIALGEESAFEASAPYGVDTYFLLTTEEPLPDPSILEWDGVRAVKPQTPLETLLMQTSAGTRSISIATPSRWSIAKTIYESLPPHTTKIAR